MNGLLEVLLDALLFAYGAGGAVALVSFWIPSFARFAPVVVGIVATNRIEAHYRSKFASRRAVVGQAAVKT